MSHVKNFPEGGFRYLEGPFQYSAGVAAMQDYAIQRVRFEHLLPLAEGFRQIERHLKNIGRPVTAFCACELRSPAPFDDKGFRNFNLEYVKPLKSWGIIRGEDNPIARSNVCPKVNPPAEPSFYAFSYTVPTSEKTDASFVISGSAESPEGSAKYEDSTVRPGEQTPSAMREKARFVLAEMERRMAALGFNWSDTSATHIYSIYNFHTLMEPELVKRGAARNGINWQYCRPPVDVLDYEMDVRGVRAEFVA